MSISGSSTKNGFHFEGLNLSALRALASKEFRQILRDKQTLVLLVVPPVLQLMLYGFALSPEVEHLRLSVLDLSSSPISREVVSALINSQTFDLHGRVENLAELNHMVASGETDVGLMISPDAMRRFKNHDPVPLQFLIDGVDANTAGIAQGYIIQIISELNRNLGSEKKTPLLIDPQVSFAYNAGLTSSWFFVPGVIGIVVVIAGTLVSSISVIREKDRGTLEQLLMTPASSSDILLAKIIPLLILLLGSLSLSLILATTVFGVPVRGSLLLVVAVSIMAIFVSISIGMALATYSGNQTQAILTSFFINIPLIQLSGALSPVESMPRIFQIIAIFDPLRYYVSALRAVLLRGVGLETIGMEVLVLFLFAVALITLSALNFRRQLQ